MTLSSESHTRRSVPTRVTRVLRGHAVEHAQPAALHVEHTAPAMSSARHASPAERIEAARAEGFAEGFAAGQEAARVSAEAARLEALQKGADALHHAAAAMEAGRTHAIAVVEEDAATLAVELTRTLVDHELSLADDDLSASVRRALRLTVPGEDLVVRLHPDEVIEATELQAYVTDCRVTVVPDDSVEHGGCIIDAGPCRIDAQIEQALARVRWALLASTRPADGAEAAEPPPTRSTQSPIVERMRKRR